MKILKNNILLELLSGSFSFLLVLLNCVTLSSIIFKDVLYPFVTIGILICIIVTICINIILNLRSSFDTIVTGPQEAPSIILSTVSASLILTYSVTKTPEVLFSSLIIIFFFCSLLTGVFFYFIGKIKIGHIIDFIPYPVICGFFAGIGFLLVKNSILILTVANISGINQFFESDLLIKILIVISFAFILFFVPLYFKKQFLFPIIVFLGFVICYLFLLYSNITIESAQTKGLLFGPFEKSSEIINFTDFFKNIDWNIVFNNLGIIPIVILFSTSNILLNISGLGVYFNKEIDVNNELKLAGQANIVSAFFGGIIGYHYFSTSIINHKIGSKSKFSSIVVIILCIPAIFFGSQIAGLFPRIILSAVLMSLGLRFLYEWLWLSRKKSSIIDYITMIIIFLLIIYFGVLQGILIGIIIASVLFVIQYSSINIIKHELTLTNIKSNVERNTSDKQRLDMYGESVYILNLQNFIFFGTSYNLYEKIKQKIYKENCTKISYVLFDFRLVKGVDSSFIMRFYQIKKILEKNNTQIILCDMNPNIEKLLKNSDLLQGDNVHKFDNFNTGLSWIETNILDVSTINDQLNDNDIMNDLFIDREITEVFISYLERRFFSKNDIIYRKGESGTDLYIVLKGEVGVLLSLENKLLRLSTIKAGNVIGEIGFFNKYDRTATVIVDNDTILYRLTYDNWARLKEKHPDIAMKFYDFTIKLLSSRIMNSNKEIQALLS